MFHQTVNLPLIVEVVRLQDLLLEEIFHSHNLSFHKLFVLTGRQHSSYFADIIGENNRQRISFIHKDTDNSLAEIAALKKSIYKFSADAVVGIGGGKVLDTAKYLATKTKLPYFAIPSVISSDALASPIAILKNSSITKGFSSLIPSGILIDYEVIQASGTNHIINGIGDIISNLSALNDWDLAVRGGKAKANNFARFLSEVSVSNLLTQKVNIKDRCFIQNYVNSIIMSGLAMNVAGNSRPCSGSEHLIAHSLVHNGYYQDIPHGYLVGHFTGFCLGLQQESVNKRTTVPTEIYHNFYLESHLNFEELQNVFEQAKYIRGHRYTILNEYSSEYLATAYIDFQENFYK